MHDETTRIMFLGDIVGVPGLSAVCAYVSERVTEDPELFVCVNAENSAPDGRGLTPAIAEQLHKAGVHCITTGNHVWAKREIIPYMITNKKLLRPANFPGGAPGVGVTVLTAPSGVKVGVLNLMGRVFMHETLDCPFRTAQSAVAFLKHHTTHIMIDMHAETTAEKYALASYLDGSVSAVFGTHTHVQTADERILPGGTAYITDVGMCGILESSIGMNKEAVIQRFLTQMPHKFTVATEGVTVITGVDVELATASGKALGIKRIRHRMG